ncbi:hypothetical protein [Xanthomonas sp. XNM01]|uniref:hypothetical protein n=1 Tax=Xanthomonas sp. XNM01 TaxID=2769289 RepID=UPI00178018B1|nr:hypothetical protein [Xanthomonas sp. XNM01]MBD9367728.1 hypothetical protein [Xanthomonas sp. XNM01]
MPNQGKGRKGVNAIHRGQHVLVTASVRFDGWSEVTEVVIVGTGRWRRPLAATCETLDAAIEAGMAYTLARFDGVPSAPPAGTVG